MLLGARRHDQVKDLFPRPTLAQAVHHVVGLDYGGEGLPPEEEVLFTLLDRSARIDQRSQQEEDDIHFPPVRCAEV